MTWKGKRIVSRGVSGDGPGNQLLMRISAREENAFQNGSNIVCNPHMCRFWCEIITCPRIPSTGPFQRIYQIPCQKNVRCTRIARHCEISGIKIKYPLKPALIDYLERIIDITSVMSSRLVPNLLCRWCPLSFEKWINPRSGTRGPEPCNVQRRKICNALLPRETTLAAPPRLYRKGRG